MTAQSCFIAVSLIQPAEEYLKSFHWPKIH